MKMASTPVGLVTATPVKLFGGVGLQSDASNTGSPVYSLTCSLLAIKLNTV